MGSVRLRTPKSRRHFKMLSHIKAQRGDWSWFQWLVTIHLKGVLQVVASEVFEERVDMNRVWARLPCSDRGE
jgi:hypothetical protein